MLMGVIGGKFPLLKQRGFMKIILVYMQLEHKMALYRLKLDT